MANNADPLADKFLDKLLAETRRVRNLDKPMPELPTTVESAVQESGLVKERPAFLQNLIDEPDPLAAVASVLGRRVIPRGL